MGSAVACEQSVGRQGEQEQHTALLQGLLQSRLLWPCMMMGSAVACEQSVGRQGEQEWHTALLQGLLQSCLLWSCMLAEQAKYVGRQEKGTSPLTVGKLTRFNN